ncbi:MAG: FAD-dependent monooxygenase [Rhodobacteraceae bacterium]|nr:FAD-dependent monooxygenase [Paracoccaceae bacterium]
MPASLSITIAGAGIAGCAAAIALAQAGHAVQVIERAARWEFASSGIFLYANGLESLRDLGVLPAILRAGFAVPEGRNAYFDQSGMPLTVTHYPSRDAGRIPAILGIRRAELHRILSMRMQELGVPVTLDASIALLAQRGGRVSLTLSDGRALETDLLVIAEGLRSTTRALAGFDVAPRYSGFTVWRSVHARPAALTDKIMQMGRGKRFGIMPISDDRLYTFGTVPGPKPAHIPRADWPATMAGQFAEFDGPARAFLDDLGPRSEVLFTAIEEVALPLPWHRGRVVVIGDAAHAATPFMGQGGAAAMADGVALARHLSRAAPEPALAAFGAERQPICAFVQEASRRVGELGALETDADIAARNARMRGGGAQAQVDTFYARLTEFERRALSPDFT